MITIDRKHDNIDAEFDKIELCDKLHSDQWRLYLEQRHRLLLAELQTLRSMLGYRPIMTGSQERKQAIGIIN